MLKIKSILGGLRNSNFRKLFVKYWILVFLCISVPLSVGVTVMQRYSDKSLLEGIDSSVRRSADNTTSTISTLLSDAISILKKEITDADVVAFLNASKTAPQSYSDMVMVRSVLNTVSINSRDGLYHSVDVYSSESERIASSYYLGQHQTIMNDKSLFDLFSMLQKAHPGQTLFAGTREDTYGRNAPKKVISIYQTMADSRNAGFVSISISKDKLISYLAKRGSDQNDSYLVVDHTGKVILDTANKLDGEYVNFLNDEPDGTPITREVDGCLMRIGVAELGEFGWKCVQMIPISELETNSRRLKLLLLEILVFGLLSSCVISYFATRKLFRPILSIMELLENPSNPMYDVEEHQEYRYLLVQILELFQKNITLESDMAERVAALRNARAKALQSQLTPHFLNNVLQTINWIAIEETQQESGRTSQAISLLSEVIRLGKEQKSNLTSVAAEVAYTEKFVELEKLRYGDEIRCHFDIDEDVREWQIPCMSIQPLVENAILHGLQPAGGEGDIYIDVRREGVFGIRLSVEDSGEGIEQEAVERIEHFLKEDYIYLGEHLGVVNLFQRFRFLYGENCVYQIKSSRYGGACFEIMVLDARTNEQN